MLSSARSAMSETEVNLHLPFQDLLAQMKNDLHSILKVDPRQVVYRDADVKYVRVSKNVSDYFRFSTPG